MLKNIKFCFLLFPLFTTVGVFGQVVDSHYKNNQPKENSPFSALGLGNINPSYFSVSSAMGGLTAGYQDLSSLNFENPAASTALRVTAYEVGLYVKNNTLTDGKGNSFNSRSGNLGYLALGFPTYNSLNEILDRTERKFRWSMGFALTPYSSVGYNISTQTNHPATDTAQVISYEIGSGGTYRLIWNNSVEYKNLSLGVNVGYIFGNMSYDKQLTFSNFNGAYSNIFNQDYSLTGFTYSLGAQYDIQIGASTKAKPTQKHLILGVYGTPSTSFLTSSNTSLRILSSQTPTDTINNITGQAGKGRLPASLTAGFIYEYTGRYRFGAQYSKTSWSDYYNDAKPGSLNDASQMTVGGEYVANAASYKGKKTRYRLGFNIGTDPRSFAGSQLNSFGITTGVGLPLVVREGLLGMINVGLEYSRLSAGNSLIQENVFKLNVGFTLNDGSWFMKKRYQ